MARKHRVGRAHDKANRRFHRAYRAQMSKRKPSIFDDWRFIWSDRTRRGHKRSWVQRLFRW